MIIKDGTGGGKTLAIDEENRARTFAVTQLFDQHVNTHDFKVWSLPFDGIDPVGADDYFFYFKNTGTEDIRVTDIRIKSSVAGTVEVHHVTGTASFTAGTKTGVSH